MKKMLFVLALCAPWCGWGQIVDGVNIWEKKEVEFLDIVGNMNPFNRKTIVAVDYGQKVDNKTDQRVEDKDGKILKFNSTIEAVNQFYAWGWDFVQVYNGEANQIRYLMRRSADK